MWPRKFWPVTKPPAEAMTPPDEDTSCQAQVEITNRRGLHARASAKFVKTVEAFDADVEVSKDGVSVPGTSIMGLLLLTAAPGDHILIKAQGSDAGAALDALVQLVEQKFHED